MCFGMFRCFCCQSNNEQCVLCTPPRLEAMSTVVWYDLIIMEELFKYSLCECITHTWLRRMAVCRIFQYPLRRRTLLEERGKEILKYNDWRQNRAREHFPPACIALGGGGSCSVVFVYVIFPEHRWLWHTLLSTRTRPLFSVNNAMAVSVWLRPSLPVDNELRDGPFQIPR